jgi:hypothetical protein
VVPARLAEPALAPRPSVGRPHAEAPQRRRYRDRQDHAAPRQRQQYIDEQLATGDYPQLAGLIPEGGMAAVWQRMHESDVAEDRFERGLERLLDGIELDLKRRRAL